MNLLQTSSETRADRSIAMNHLQEASTTEYTVTKPALRVFLVEDSPHVRDLLLDFLNVPGEIEIVGYADNETESVAALLAEPVDAVIVDLKLRGTAIYVDAARLYALAHGIGATSTRERLQAAGKALGASAQEAEAWVGGFEFLQMLRLQVQLSRDRREAVDASDGNPNLIDVAALNDIDRRVLKESLRVARRLQQRIQMDYQR